MKNSEKQAIAQILKMNATIYKIEKQMEYEAGNDWIERKGRNEKRSERIQAIEKKIAAYAEVITEEGFNNSDLPIMLCCNYEEFKA